MKGDRELNLDEGLQYCNMKQNFKNGNKLTNHDITPDFKHFLFSHISICNSCLIALVEYDQIWFSFELDVTKTFPCLN